MTERPLRVCMITTFYPPYAFGGDAVYVERMSHELALRGHHVEVIHCVDAYRILAGGPSHLPEPETGRGVVVHRLRSRLGPLSPLLTQQTGLPLLKASRIRSVLATGFDVIHYHNISLVGGPGVLALGSGLKLYTLHECWLVCPAHVLFRMNRHLCHRPTCLRCTLVHRRPPQWWRYSGLMRRSLRHVDAFLAPSRFSDRIHRERGLDLPVVHFPSFSPRPEAPRTAAAPPFGGEPYFLFVGRLERLKGLHTVVPVIRGEPRARLVVAGTGADEARLRRLADGDPRIVFLGHLTAPALAELYLGATALIVPSLVPEIFPLVLLEAFAHRTAVIVRDRGGLPDPVRESGGGIVFGTEHELVAALRHLLDEPTAAVAMGEAGHRAWQHRWTAEVHVDRYVELVNNLRAGRPAGGSR